MPKETKEPEKTGVESRAESPRIRNGHEGVFLTAKNAKHAKRDRLVCVPFRLAYFAYLAVKNPLVFPTRETESASPCLALVCGRKSCSCATAVQNAGATDQAAGCEVGHGGVETGLSLKALGELQAMAGIGVCHGSAVDTVAVRGRRRLDEDIAAPEPVENRRSKKRTPQRGVPYPRKLPDLAGAGVANFSRLAVVAFGFVVR